jgi:hypothetical protein
MIRLLRWYSYKRLDRICSRRLVAMGCFQADWRAYNAIIEKVGFPHDD